MPLPLFHRSPRPEDSPASTSSSRFGAIQQNVRSMLNGSSTYSDSPAPSSNNTPKPPFLGFLRRPQSPPTPITVPDSEPPRESTSSRSPLHPQHTAGSYQRAIGRPDEPRLPETVYTRPTGAQSLDYNRHPADVPLEYTRSVDPETEQLANEVNGRRHHRRRRRRRKHRHHQRGGAWVRRKSDRAMCFGFMKSQAARGKCFACLISGLFLLTVLTIYLSLALTKKNLGQEVHVLFIMVILGTTIFFCHSLIRLCMLALHPEMDTPRIPSMAGPEGFRPVNPIRVHLARDDELADEEEQLGEEEDEFDPNHEKPAAAKLQPPSYGLWRSSIRIDPNLLHWQKVEDVPSVSNSRNGSSSNVSTQQQQQQEETGARPPSYMSDDGVDYVVEAAPRSTVYVPTNDGMSDVHPAWRPGFAVSEVGDLPPTAPRRV